MASDKLENKKDKKDKKDKKEKKEKKNKHTEDGVSKPKSDKKEKKSKGKSEGIVEQISTAASALLPSALNGGADDHDDEDDGDAMEVDAPARDVPDDALVPFANPLADEKQTKKLLKGVKRAAQNKTVKRGVKEVVKHLRKSPQNGPPSSDNKDPLGVVIIAADISPMDVISHIPVLCEDHNVPYIYVRSRAELGSAGNTKRATSVVMVTKERTGKGEGALDAEYLESYADLVKLVRKAGVSVLR